MSQKYKRILFLDVHIDTNRFFFEKLLNILCPIVWCPSIYLIFFYRLKFCLFPNFVMNNFILLLSMPSPNMVYKDYPSQKHLKILNNMLLTCPWMHWWPANKVSNITLRLEMKINQMPWSVCVCHYRVYILKPLKPSVIVFRDGTLEDNYVMKVELSWWE